MQTEDKIIKNKNKSFQDTVHHVLARSYSSYLLFFIIGVLLEFVFPIHIFKGEEVVEIGIMILIFASILILWAQNTSRHLNQENITKETFLGGPYSFTRSPTHWGLFFLIFGFGIMMNSLFIILFAIISIFVAKLFFLRREEKLLADKYGNPYMEYKKIVRI